ncbi:MAG: D-2-hydroxyacid dehydrogenase [Bacteroidales bacterium]|nr:D-2-hydroxyacid dehydrogenase [Bacteroidales bacterium]
MKIVFLDAYSISDTDLAPLQRLGNFIAYDFTTPEQTVERCKDADIVITNKVLLFSKELEQLPKLKLICVAATGTNNVDTSYAEEKGIIVKNVAGYSTSSVAECTLMFALALSHQLLYYDNFIKDKSYSKSNRTFHLARAFSEMSSKKWGIIGLGNIGKNVARLATELGAQVCYYSTSRRNTDTDYPSVSLDELLSESDIISIHAPLNPQTENLITYDKLCRMKKSAYIINVARGGIINEAGLAQALNEERISGAATDVFSKEPLPSDNSLLNIKDPTRLLLTPHLSWASSEARQRLVDGIAQNIISFTENKR